MKKILSLLLVAMMLTSILPVMAAETADSTITAYITISQYGQIVNDKNGTAVALAPVELSGKESYTLDDLFRAAHDLYYEGGAEAGYSTYESSWGLSIGTMWGDTSGNVIYQINAGKVYVMGPDNEVNDGDCVDAYILQSYSENYAYFDKYTAEVAVGEALPLTLTEMGYDVSYNTVYTPSAGATITIDGVETEYKTDTEGKVTLTFGRPGTYVVSAVKTNGEVTAISAPVCVVTVGLPESDYAVTVKVGPSTANVKFYNCAGFDESKKDILGEEITAFDDGVISNYHQYTLIVPKGRYSFRGTDAEGDSLGGMTFTVPSSDTSEYTITLRQLDVYTTTKYDGTSYTTENEYTTTVADYEENFATAGIPYKSGNYTRYPYLLCAYGNPFPYAIQLVPDADIAEAYSLGVNSMSGYALSAGTSVTTKSGTLPTLLNATVNAPAGSKVQVFNQIKNFYTEEISYSSTTEGENGTINYIYRLPKDDGKHSYRVSMDGKITKAGYFNLKTEEDAQVTITFADNEDPKVRPEYDRSVASQKSIEDSILLNINEQNYLRLEQGEEFTARAYRALQIVNSNTANIMIEPDFHYNIISGDSVTLDQQGQKAVLRAVKNGISVIEVTYDAIQVGSTLYGAIDPNRTGIFVVNVGGNTSTAIDMTDWDSDLDTVYFLGETGTFNFAPTSDAEMTVEADGTVISANADNTYTIPVKQGNNLITVTADNNTEYLVVKGDKITANIENITNPDSPIKQGDTIQVSFDGLHMPVPKFSGVYNPGYGSTMKIAYTLSDGSKILTKGTQYDFISNHAITLNVFDEGILKLTGGSISMTSMGAPFGSHRSITDKGITTNFNAGEVAGDFSILPDIEIEVLKSEKIIVKNTDYSDGLASVTLIAPAEKNINVFIGSYEDIFLKGLACTSTHLKEGETTVTVDCSALTNKDTLYMLIWDETMTEITGKISLN